MKFLLFIWLFPVVCFSQRPSLYFEKLTVRNGLSHNKVNCIVQDSRGFIWLGTDDGLNRFDGRQFTHFKSVPGDTTTVSGNIINDLLEDREGRLWIATADGGISRYDHRLPPQQQFKRYSQLSGNGAPGPLNAVNTLLEDASGYLWLGTSGRSVLRFEKNNGKIKDITGTAKTILDLCLDKDGIIWVGRQGGGIQKINPSTLSSTEDERYRNLYAQLPHVTVTALFRDRSGGMWFGSWDKVLYRYNPVTGKEEVFKKQNGNSFQDDEVRCFVEDNRGWLWMGGKEKGLQLYDKQAGRFYHYTYSAANDGSLSDNRINTIFMDKQGLVWIGTDQGVCVNNPQKQHFWQQFLPGTGKEPLTIYDFFENKDGDVWIGTSQGIFIQKKDGSIAQRKLSYKGLPLHITSFYVHDDGTFYLGTNYSLFRYNTVNHTLSLLPNTEKDGVMNRIISSRVVSVVSTTVDKRPVMMVSPYGHYLAYYDLERKRWISRLDSSNIIQRFHLTDNLIRKFQKTGDGTILLATAKSGLGIWSPGTQQVKYHLYDPANPYSINNNNVSDICEGKGDNLWVSTYGGGLHSFDTRTKKFTHIPESNNLVEAIKVDHHGDVWMISNGHLQKYNPLRKTFTAYQLPDVEKTGGVRGKIFTDSRGKMYVAGTNYFISFHPDSIKVTTTEPRVVFTNFQIFNQSFSHLLLQDRITLKHKENYFTFEFAAPLFAPANTVHYSYMLEGFDKDWVDAAERNYVSYTNLEGGDYTFKVRATTTPGSWSRHMAIIRLTVVPPYWQRAWFYVLCAVFLGGAGYLMYRYRINQILKQQAIRNRIAQDLHDNVGSTLSSISVYSQVAKIYQQKERENDLRSTLEKISSTSTEMISELNDTVWVINPRNDNMDVILQRMESFAKPLSAAQGIAFHFQYDASLPFQHLEMEKRKSFYAIYKEAVNNAIKYAECKNLRVAIQKKSHKVFMTITDDGKGFDLSKTSEGYKSSDVFGDGNGLKNMQQRAAAMGGHLRMKSEPGKGTTVELQFPIP